MKTNNLIIGDRYRNTKGYKFFGYYLGKCYIYRPKINLIDNFIISLEYNPIPEAVYCLYFDVFKFLSETELANYVNIGGCWNQAEIDKRLKEFEYELETQRGWKLTKNEIKKGYNISEISQNVIKLEKKDSTEINFDFNLISDNLWMYSSFIYLFSSMEDALRYQPLFQDAESIIKMLTS